MKNLINKIKPLVYYNKLIEDKLSIYKENRNKAAIYIWVNKINNKSYIGSAIDLSNRLRVYYSFKLMKNILIKGSSPIYSAILKYGYENSNLEILEYCKADELLVREQYYLDLLIPEYNIFKIAGSRLGSKATYETKKAISISSRGCKIINNINVETLNLRSKIITSDTKNKLSLRS